MTELILALDITPAARALEVATVCAPHIEALKIGYPLALSAGLQIADDLAALGPRLIADFKVADIPNTNRLICEEVFAAGFDAVIVHGFTGADAVQACVETARAHGGSTYVVAEMSHPGAVEFFHAGIAERIAGLAVACGADGIIAPATRPDRVKALRAIVGNRTIYSPGVGAQGGTPEAVAGDADGIIVGRMIYEARDPAAVAASIAATIRR